jgi:5'-nucleotidase
VTLTASAASQIYGSPNRVTLTATVKSSDGSPVTGTVDFHNGDKPLGSAPIDNGVATYQLASETDVGTLNVTASVDGVESDPVTVTVNQASSLTLLLSTASSYRQGAFLPAILLAGVGLNNGQSARGTVQISVDGQLGPKLPLTYGLAIYLPPRSLVKGKHTFVATFEPTDSTNIAGSSSQPVVIQVR